MCRPSLHHSPHTDPARSPRMHCKQITEEEYGAAQPDPVAPFSAPVAGHMNADHAEATVAMMKHYVGITGEKGVSGPGMPSGSFLGWGVLCGVGWMLLFFSRSVLQTPVH